MKSLLINHFIKYFKYITEISITMNANITLASVKIGFYLNLYLIVQLSVSVRISCTLQPTCLICRIFGVRVLFWKQLWKSFAEAKNIKHCYIMDKSDYSF